MLSLGGEEWTDYFFPAPGSPTRRGYGDDGDSDDDGSLCKSPEPSSPPSSSSVFVDGDDSDWYPRIPSLDMSPGSPRSVRENNLDLSASLCMCVYDLDTLCTTGEESSEFHSSQIFDENQFQNSSKILPYIVDLFNPSSGQNEHELVNEKEEPMIHVQQPPIHKSFLLPMENESRSSAPPHRKQRKRRSRTRVNLASGRAVLVESCFEPVPEGDEEQIEVIYLRVRLRKPPPPLFFVT